MSINESIDSSQSDTPPASRSSSRANISRLRKLPDQLSSRSKEAISSQERFAQHSAQLAMSHPEEQNLHNFHSMPNRTTLQSQQVKTSNRRDQALQGQEINMSDRHVQAQQGQLNNMSNRHDQSQQGQQIKMSSRHDQAQQGQQVYMSDRHDHEQLGQQVNMSIRRDKAMQGQRVNMSSKQGQSPLVQQTHVANRLEYVPNGEKQDLLVHQINVPSRRMETRRGPSDNMHESYDSARGPNDNVPESYNARKSPIDDVRESYETRRGSIDEVHISYNSRRGPSDDAHESNDTLIEQKGVGVAQWNDKDSGYHGSETLSQGYRGATLTMSRGRQKEQIKQHHLINRFQS